MPIELLFDHCDQPFRPGDTITGCVNVAETSEASIDDIHLVLEGRAKTKTKEHRGGANGGTNHHTYRSRVPLLYEAHKVDYANSRSTTLSVQFSITLPANAAQLRGLPELGHSGLTSDYWTYEWKADSLFASTPGCPLPPSMSCVSGGWRKQSECYIEYSITAVGSSLDRGSNTLQPHKFDTKPFWLTITSPYSLGAGASLDRLLHEQKQSINIQSIRFLSEVAARNDHKLSFKEKLKNAVHTSSCPTANLPITVSVPEILFAGKKVPLEMRMDPIEWLPTKDDMDTSHFVFPGLQVNKVSVKLRQWTYVRNPGTFTDHTDAFDEEAYSCSVAPAELPRWVGNPPAPGSYASNAFDGTAQGSSRALPLATALPKQLAPSFETYNIARNYRLEIEIEISCAEETKSLHFAEPVMVCSQPRDETRAKQGATTISAYSAGSDREYNAHNVDQNGEYGMSENWTLPRLHPDQAEEAQTLAKALITRM